MLLLELAIQPPNVYTIVQDRRVFNQVAMESLAGSLDSRWEVGLGTAYRAPKCNYSYLEVLSSKLEDWGLS